MSWKRNALLAVVALLTLANIAYFIAKAPRPLDPRKLTDVTFDIAFAQPCPDDMWGAEDIVFSQPAVFDAGTGEWLHKGQRSATLEAFIEDARWRSDVNLTPRVAMPEYAGFGDAVAAFRNLGETGVCGAFWPGFPKENDYGEFARLQFLEVRSYMAKGGTRLLCGGRPVPDSKGLATATALADYTPPCGVDHIVEN